MPKKVPALLMLTLVTVGCHRSLRQIDSTKFSYELTEIRPDVRLAIPPSASTLGFEANLRVRNDNEVTVRLERIDFELLIDGKRALTGQTLERIALPASGTGLVRLRALATAEQLRGVAGELGQIIRGHETRYTLRGTAHYRAFLRLIELPFSVDAQRAVTLR